MLHLSSPASSRMIDKLTISISKAMSLSQTLLPAHSIIRRALPGSLAETSKFVNGCLTARGIMDFCNRMLTVRKKTHLTKARLVDLPDIDQAQWKSDHAEMVACVKLKNLMTRRMRLSMRLGSWDRGLNPLLWRSMPMPMRTKRFLRVQSEEEVFERRRALRYVETAKKSRPRKR